MCIIWGGGRWLRYRRRKGNLGKDEVFFSAQLSIGNSLESGSGEKSKE
jgi:hypothetical protein